jgi:hypothetical protein
MKKLLMPVVALVTAGLVAFGPNAMAGNAKTLYYVGKTAQHQDLEFHVRQTSTRSFAVPVSFSMKLRCPVTGDAGLADFLFFGFQVPVHKDGSFSLDLNDLQDAFHWGGTITGKTAQGTLSFGFPAFTYDGGLQSCGSGDVSWTASELVPALRLRSSATGSVTQIRVSRDAATGKVTITTTK